MTQESAHAFSQTISLILKASIGNSEVELWARDITMKPTNASRKSRKILSASFSFD